ncbi:MAG TPA: DUF4136 domain-containing protein [Cyclobacteriaceae bacterium]|jgi:hypothetical protein|nr:DUF4136 domain-containing protein [Cytophagales bacterium]HMR55672.1 DUF4136 domain-containing protein [Cyclobacteriaceae bacterium]HNT51132.1 DUF4136 domain-containing protein [Cyclobacteriaceae bacterium]HRE68417.1 DUF4136 domain-containing protein [Cyclobacteriaceae bacterium]HRF31864.1 DUF4136 domain-containing protein [Cyclobacteriaceae bacterium]
MRSLLLILVLFSVGVKAQEIKVEFDKSHDFTQYKTYRIGDAEVITPKDQKKVPDEEIKKWIEKAINNELTQKGLQQVDSSADLVVSYVVGTLSRSDMGNVGPMGMTPGSTERTYIRDYQQGSLIIDLNNNKNFLVWRINSTTNMSSAEGERLISQIVQRGFKQFGKPVKRKK